jgi:hypothetical protein
MLAAQRLRSAFDRLRGPRAIATGLAALDRGIRGDKFADKTWPQDRDVALIIRGSVNPRTRDDAPALQAILLARRTRA